MTAAPLRPARGLVLALVVLAALGGPAFGQGAAPPVGTAALSSQTASKFFNAVCLRSAPGFGQAPATLGANRFAPNPETGTFFHPDLNLSFQVAQGRCSMVFASDAPATEVALAFAAATMLASGSDAAIALDPTAGRAEIAGPAGTRMMVEPFTAPSGQSYFRALLAPAP